MPAATPAPALFTASAAARGTQARTGGRGSAPSTGERSQSSRNHSPMASSTRPPSISASPAGRNRPADAPSARDSQVTTVVTPPRIRHPPGDTVSPRAAYPMERRMVSRLQAMVKTSMAPMEERISNLPPPFRPSYAGSREGVKAAFSSEKGIKNAGLPQMRQPCGCFCVKFGQAVPSSFSRRRRIRGNFQANMRPVVVAARASATGSATYTAKTWFPVRM